ncbi:MAG: hypothetical protein WEB59_05395 [Thermoanaerobaculia bacterium]
MSDSKTSAAGSISRVTPYVNGGRHGFLVEIRPEDLRRPLAPAAVRVAIQRGAS